MSIELAVTVSLLIAIFMARLMYVRMSLLRARRRLSDLGLTWQVPPYAETVKNDIRHALDSVNRLYRVDEERPVSNWFRPNCVRFVATRSNVAGTCIVIHHVVRVRGPRLGREVGHGVVVMRSPSFGSPHEPEFATPWRVGACRQAEKQGHRARSLSKELKPVCATLDLLWTDGAVLVAVFRNGFGSHAVAGFRKLDGDITAGKGPFAEREAAG